MYLLPHYLVTTLVPVAGTKQAMVKRFTRYAREEERKTTSTVEIQLETRELTYFRE